MLESLLIEELLDQFLGPKLGYRPATWPRRVLELLDRLAKADGLGPIEFLKELLQHDNAAVSEVFIDATTVGHTAFFRHADQFEELAVVLSELAPLQRRPLRVWCAGCSTGEEAYSVGLTAGRVGVAVDILATDVNPVAIRFARAGHYTASRPEHLPGCPEGRQWLAPEDLRQKIHFEVASVVSASPARRQGPFDIILCRNVLIYFEHNDVACVLKGLSQQLVPSGALVVSPVDAVLPMPDCVRRSAATGWLKVAGNIPTTRVAGTESHASVIPRAGAVREPALTAFRMSHRPAPRVAPVDEAAQLLASGKLDDAERVLTELLNREPTCMAGWFLLGETLMQRGEVAQARAAYLRVSRATPSNARGSDGEALRWSAEKKVEELSRIKWSPTSSPD